MSCCLCLAETLSILDVFGANGSSININQVIRQFFWIKPTENDVICTMCCNALESFDNFYKSIELAHNIQRELVHEDELPFIELEPIEPKVSIEEIILQPKIEPVEVEAILVDPVDEQVDTLSVTQKRSKNKNTSDFEILQNKKKEKAKSQPKRKIKNEKSDEKLSISPTRRSLRHQKEDIKAEKVDESEVVNVMDFDEAIVEDRSDDEEYEPADEPYDPNEPSSNSEEEMDEDFEVKVKTERKSTEAVGGQNKPKRKYKKLTPEEKEAKKNKASSKQMKICAEWDQFLADFGFVFKCKICDYIGKDFRDLKGHFRVVHDKPRGYAMCCDRIFYKKEVLVEHIQFHINPEHFKCNNCGMTFKASKSLEYHSIHTCKSINSEDVKKLFQCDECLKWFNSKFLLQRHKLSHMPLEERQWKCTVADCGKLFVGPKDLESHIKRMHEMISSTLCEQCGKVVQNSKMSAHRLEHQGKKPEMIECHLCGAKLRCDLNRHIEAMHTNSDEKHVCHVCGKESSNFYALRKHILYNHQMERKFECTICDKKFKQRYNLKEHMAVHTGESLYNCPHCEWRFKSSANMHTHIKRRHRTEWEENRKYRNYSKSKTGKVVLKETVEIREENVEIPSFNIVDEAMSYQ